MDMSADDEAKAKKFQMTIPTEVKAAPLIYAGPFPPPTHGQSLCTEALAKRLAQHGVALAPVDIGAAGGKFVGKTTLKLFRHMRLLLDARNARVVYISANSNAGMWLTAAISWTLRVTGKQLFIHHHAFDHVRRRRASMVALARAAGAEATHIVLGRNMADLLLLHTPEVGRTMILNNAGLVDDTLISSQSSADGICLGHLSNLSKEKGIIEVVDLALRLARSGVRARLVIAGPTTDNDATEAISRASDALGTDFEYMGPVSGERKEEFFAKISHFVFPTRYRNEASPMVLLEAMAAGIPCIATDTGCISNDVDADGGLVVDLSDDFPAVAEAWITSENGTETRAGRARAQFMRLRREHEDQVGELVSLLARAGATMVSPR